MDDGLSEQLSPEHPHLQHANADLGGNLPSGQTPADRVDLDRAVVESAKFGLCVKTPQISHDMQQAVWLVRRRRIDVG